MTPEENEDRFESIEMILKQRDDGTSWFDYLFDLITENCEGGGGTCLVEEGDESDCDDHEHNEILPCTCGMEHMGGRSGTLEQCYEHQTNVAANISPIMLARTIVALWEHRQGDDDTARVLTWAHKEIEMEDYFENKGWEKEGEETTSETEEDNVKE